MIIHYSTALMGKQIMCLLGLVLVHLAENVACCTMFANLKTGPSHKPRFTLKA